MTAGSQSDVVELSIFKNIRRDDRCGAEWRDWIAVVPTERYALPQKSERISRLFWATSDSPSSCHYGRRGRTHRGLRSSRGGVREVREHRKAFFGIQLARAREDPIFHHDRASFPSWASADGFAPNHSSKLRGLFRQPDQRGGLVLPGRC